ncbi:hypothetical protein [Ereboglobus luteus]|nr:hypothetical protein [Ereboglobus luteus]
MSNAQALSMEALTQERAVRITSLCSAFYNEHMAEWALFPGTRASCPQ